MEIRLLIIFIRRAQNVAIAALIEEQLWSWPNPNPSRLQCAVRLIELSEASAYENVLANAKQQFIDLNGQKYKRS